MESAKFKRQFGQPTETLRMAAQSWRCWIAMTRESVPARYQPWRCSA
jgi:hypothetical protein